MLHINELVNPDDRKNFIIKYIGESEEIDFATAQQSKFDSKNPEFLVRFRSDDKQVIEKAKDSFIQAYNNFIQESIKEEDCNCEQGFSNNTKVDLLNTKKLCVLAVATSIDAVAVGVSLAVIFLPIVKIGFVTLSTAIITALASYIGVKWGQKLGCAIGKKAELFGGFILILIGIKILIEHLFFA